MKEDLALFSAVLIIAGAPPYIINTIKGRTRPERITWLIFSVLGLIAFVSQFYLGVILVVALFGHGYGR